MCKQVWLALGGSVSGPKWRIAILTRSGKNQNECIIPLSVFFRKCVEPQKLDGRTDERTNEPISIAPKRRCGDSNDDSVKSRKIFTAPPGKLLLHYDDVIMTMLASQITSLTVVYSIVYSGVNQRKHQSSASLAFVREIHRGPVNFPQKWPVTRKMFPFDDVIIEFYGHFRCLQIISST